MTIVFDEAIRAREGDAHELAGALTASREDTLATFSVLERSLDDLAVPQRETLNPPLWELGHIGWFQEFWIGRNPLRFAGPSADPHVARSPGIRKEADALYDSGKVAHGTRWALPLPDAEATRADLAAQLGDTLARLSNSVSSDAALYFFRLALFHEDMHHEAALYMSQSLGVPIDDRRWQPGGLPARCRQLSFDAGPWMQGSDFEPFAFDNELSRHRVALTSTCIDSRVVRWAEYLPFVEAGGYGQARWWSEAGARWLASSQLRAPRYLRRDGATWQRWRHGVWQALEATEPACHLTAHEAQAWCRWAGRRLPTEAEWERAAIEATGEFEWGQVWEWTASLFLPYPDFEAHAYRDYSAPWFGTRGGPARGVVHDAAASASSALPQFLHARPQRRTGWIPELPGVVTLQPRRMLWVETQRPVNSLRRVTRGGGGSAPVFTGSSVYFSCQ